MISKILEFWNEDKTKENEKNLLKTIYNKGFDFSSREVLLFDNATMHNVGKIRPIMQEYNFIELDHSAHSPDLAPSDFHLSNRKWLLCKPERIFYTEIGRNALI